MENVCRSCLCQHEVMQNIYDMRENQEVCLAEIYTMCTTVKVEKADGLPESMCEQCKIKLLVAYDFRLQSQRTDIYLRKKFFPDLDIKLDYNDDDDADYGNINDDGPDLSPKHEPDMFDSKPDIFDKRFSHSENLTDNNLDCHLDDFNEIGEIDLKRSSRNVKSKDKDLNFQCTFCFKALTTSVGLEIHMRRHTGQNLYPCEECDKSFTKSSHLKRHMLNKHNKSPLKSSDRPSRKQDLSCEYCDRKFKYRKSFTHHLKIEHGIDNGNDSDDTPLIDLIRTDLLSVEKAAEIDKAHSENEPLLNVEVQMQEHNDVENENENCLPLSDNVQNSDILDNKSLKDDKENFTCHVCEATFKRANHLTKHMTLHRALLVHGCKDCEKAFATEADLQKHNQEEHVNKPYVCNMCLRSFSRGEHLIRHLKVHAKEKTIFSCSVCPKVYNKLDLLIKHIKMHLRSDKRHKCSICGKAFNRYDNMKTHEKIHSMQKGNGKSHLCIYCGKEFNNSSNMIVHMRRHTGERPYKCDVCGKGFPRSHDLKCHERTHSGEKPYLCTLCGKAFNKSNKLLRHTRVHTGERPYKCDLCGRAFTQSNDLSLHMRRHTGARPYACGECPARFIQSGQLKAHRRSAGHWIEHPPDLKGGYRVEPVVPLTEPVPVKFKTYGRKKEVVDTTDDEDNPANFAVNNAGILTNINLQAQLMQQNSSSLVPDNGNDVNSSTQIALQSIECAIQREHLMNSESKNDIKSEKHLKLMDKIAANTFQEYSNESVSYTSVPCNYQSYD